MQSSPAVQTCLLSSSAMRWYEEKYQIFFFPSSFSMELDDDQASFFLSFFVAGGRKDHCIAALRIE